MPKLGHKDNPYLVAPEGFEEHGWPADVFYPYCKCSKCGLVTRSTITFDYYAEKAGDPLVCESCELRCPRELAKLSEEIHDQIIAESN